MGLTHDVHGKHNNCRVAIYATKPGSGSKGGALGRRILNQLGFSSFTIKGRGRRTPYSFVAATFDALAQHGDQRLMPRRASGGRGNSPNSASAQARDAGADRHAPGPAHPGDRVRHRPEAGHPAADLRAGGEYITINLQHCRFRLVHTASRQ